MAINVLMMVSWYSSYDGTMKAGNFHSIQAAELNKHCNCAIYYPYDRSISDVYTRRVENGVVTYRSGYKLEKKIRNRYFMLTAMKKIIQDFHPDIIHGNVATESGRFAVMLGQIFHIPVMITEHSAVEASGVTSFPHYYYAKRVYKYSRYNACVSDHLTSELSKIFPKYTFHTVYNGIQDVKMQDVSNVNKYRVDGCVNACIVASFYDKDIKGMQYLMPALKKLHDEGTDIYLHVIGGGEFLQEYEQQAEREGMNAYIRFYGECLHEKVFEIDSEMDFTISASIFESFGCAVAEGMMLGKPCVATKSGGTESIINEDNGLLVEKESTESLYEGIKKMCEIYDRYDSRLISKEAHDKFSIEVITNKYLEIYNDIIR